MKSKISIYTIILVVFFIIYSFWISSSFNEIQLSYDETRHAAAGMIWYDYVKTIFSDGYMPFSTFVAQYQKMGYNAGWFVNQDPPVDGLIRVPFYYIFGPTFFGIRVMALVCALISGVLVYVIAYKITKKRIIALVSSVVLLMSTLFYMYSAIQALAPIPNAMMVLFWYYFTFVRESKKNYRIKLFKDGYVNFNWNIIVGGLFLTFATLIKYSAVLFIDIFFVLYILYLLIAHFMKNKKISFRLLSESDALQIAFVAFLQNIVFLVISWRWLQYNLFENRFLERLLYTSSKEIRSCPHDLNYLDIKYPFLGYGTLFSNFTYMIHGYLQRTLFFNIFFVYTVYLLFKRKIEDEYTKKHFVIISLFFLAVYLFFSFKMSNHQIRYIIHPFPFVVIGAAYGLYWLIYNCFRKKQVLIYTVVVLVFICSLFLLNTWIYNKTYEEFGPKNEELLEFLKTKPDPKFLLHTVGRGGADMSELWYYNPDLAMFTFMRSKQGHNPFTFKQNAHLVHFGERNTTQSVESISPSLVNQLKGISDNIPTYVAIFRYNRYREIYDVFGGGLVKNNFSEMNLTYWTVYYKE